MKKFLTSILSFILVISILGEIGYITIANSISSDNIKTSIKNNLLTGFIYDDKGNKTEIFNTILRLTGLDEETAIKIMENETADAIITDLVNSIYDYNLTKEDKYKYSKEKIISLVEDNIDKILQEIDYNISAYDRNEVLEYTRTHTDYIIDTIYSADIGDYKR